jgi:hypothetical protein
MSLEARAAIVVFRLCLSAIIADKFDGIGLSLGNSLIKAF